MPSASARREIQPLADRRLAPGFFDRQLNRRRPVRLVRAAPWIRSRLETNAERTVEVVRQPDSPFTIVEPNETLEDVARRIYGSGDHVDSLWRANRDALPQRNSPLSAGMVLRTPNEGAAVSLMTATLDCAAEVDDVAVLDDVFLALEPLQVPGLGLFEGAGGVEVVERGDLGADEALGEVGVDLAGGLDGGGPALEVPAADLGLAGGEERDDADRVVSLADDPVAAQLAARPGRS